MNEFLAILTVLVLGAVGGFFGGMGFGLILAKKIEKQIVPKLDAYIEDLKKLNDSF